MAIGRASLAALLFGLFVVASVLLQKRGSFRGPTDSAASVLHNSLELAEARLAILKSRLETSSATNSRLMRENARLREETGRLENLLAKLPSRRAASTVEATTTVATAPAKPAEPAKPLPSGYRTPSALSERLLESTEFNKERAQLVAGSSKQIMLTFSNKIRLDFVTSWVHHVRRLGMTNYLVGATDAASLEAMKKDKVQCFLMQTTMPQGEWAWGSRSFKALGPHKIEMIYKSLTWGLEVVITDSDAFILRDPFPFMARCLGLGLGLGLGFGLTVTVTLTLTLP